MATATSPWATKANNSDGGDYERPLPGTYPAVCVALIDLGTHTRTFNNETKEQHKLYFVWELTGEADSKGNNFVLAQDYNWSLHKKATLRGVVESWIGRALKDEEEFEIISLLGKPCLLGVTEGTSSSGKKFCEIASIAAPMKGLTIPPATHELFAFNLALIGGSAADPPIPSWVPPIYGRSIVDEIKKSAEWGQLAPF